jgi:hypothetical protein
VGGTGLIFRFEGVSWGILNAFFLCWYEGLAQRSFLERHFDVSECNWQLFHRIYYSHNIGEINQGPIHAL